MPKIAFVNTVCSGSHGRLIADLKRAAKKEGFDAKVAFGRGAFAPDDVRIGSRMDVLSHVAITRVFDAHGEGSRRATRAFVNNLSAFDPDIIHLHNAHGYYLHLETFFSFIRQRRIQTLWTLHDCWAFTGHCSHFIRANCERYQTGCHDCPLKNEYPASLLLDASRKNWQNKKRMFAGIDTLKIICPSVWLDQVVSKSFLRDLPRAVIPNGVDLSLFSGKRDASLRRQFSVPEGQHLLLSVASPFDHRKGFGDLLTLSKRLDGKATLVMVGLSKKQMRLLPPNVRGIRKTDGPEDLVRLYAEADCFLNASHEETYPTVNMEAMACGTPVAAYDVGGCTEQITAGVGAIVARGNIDALCSAAMALSRAKDRMSSACKAHAEAHFDREKAIAKYVAEYTQMGRV